MQNNEQLLPQNLIPKQVTQEKFNNSNVDCCALIFWKNNKLLLFGGNPQIIQYDIFTRQFSTLDSKIPSGMRLYTIAPFDNALYVFGGVLEGVRLNRMYRYEPDTQETIQIAYQQDNMNVPCGRNSHAACLGYANDASQTIMYMHGGYDGTELLSSLYTYHFASNMWKLLPQLDIPRSSHVMCNIKDQYLIVLNGAKPYPEVCMFHIALQQWQVFANEYAFNGYDAGSCLFRNHILVRGGNRYEYASFEEKSKLRYLNLENRKWYTLQLANVDNCSKETHMIARDNQIFIVAETNLYIVDFEPDFASKFQKLLYKQQQNKTYCNVKIVFAM